MMYRKMGPKELEKLMEEMANLPKEEIGKRQPGERGTLERQYNASRIQLEGH